VTGPPPSAELSPWTGPDPLAEQPLRLPYARPGGPAADLAWADAALAAAGRERTGPAVQGRTWNLSSIWQLPTADGTAWLKVVPPFFAHEGAVLPLLDPAIVPPVLGAEPGRVLLGEVSGEDQYDATGDTLLEMVRMLVRLQVGWIDRTSELLALGAPDLRPATLIPRIRAAAARHRDELNDAEQQRIAELISGLPGRFAEIAACGIPDTLVHGDFHPGNVRGEPGRLVILAWGDCAVGHPMIDQLAFVQRWDCADREAAGRLWVQEWRTVLPGCDAGRAATLLRPAAALYGAVVYQHFLDNIEPDEHPYHAHDPLGALKHAADLTD